MPSGESARDTMPWDDRHFPPAMSGLPEPVRDKAIAIANALLARGKDDGSAIRIAIVQAWRWARGRDRRDRGAAPPD